MAFLKNSPSLVKFENRVQHYICLYFANGVSSDVQVYGGVSPILSVDVNGAIGKVTLPLLKGVNTYLLLKDYKVEFKTRPHLKTGALCGNGMYDRPPLVLCAEFQHDMVDP